MKRAPKIAITVLGLIVVILAGSAAYTPYIGVELLALGGGEKSLREKPKDAVLQNDYWSVREIAPGVFAIGEPLYWQVNWNYLIVGEERAVLLDTGQGVKSISAVVKGLTDKPVSVMVSHFHYDHVGGVDEFDRVDMIDLPKIRAQAKDDVLYLSRYQHLGVTESRPAPVIEIAKWIKPGEKIELGGRELELHATPGHTIESLSLYDAKSGILFTGDYLYIGPLIALLPSSSRASYIQTAMDIVNHFPADTRILGAHGNLISLTEPPFQSIEIVQKLKTKLIEAENEKIRYSGFFPRILAIEGEVEFFTGFPWHNR